jgi:hypothetical protein
MSRLGMITLLYVGWIVAHYIATHAYVKWCTPYTFWGIISSPFLASAPHCIGLRWAIHTGGNNIMAMWVIIALWGVKKTNILNY